MEHIPLCIYSLILNLINFSRSMTQLQAFLGGESYAAGEVSDDLTHISTVWKLTEITFKKGEWVAPVTGWGLLKDVNVWQTSLYSMQFLRTWLIFQLFENKRMSAEKAVQVVTGTGWGLVKKIVNVRILFRIQCIAMQLHKFLRTFEKTNNERLSTEKGVTSSKLSMSKN